MKNKYIDENIDLNILMEFINEWLDINEYLGMIAVKITYARRVEHWEKYPSCMIINQDPNSFNVQEIHHIKCHFQSMKRDLEINQ